MTWGQIVTLILVFLYSFLIGFARIYVRVHSWNQIVYGWQLGLWLAFYFHFCLREGVIKHVNITASAQKILEKDRARHILVATCIIAVVVIINVGTYALSINLSEPGPAWTLMIEQKCPKKEFGKSKFFADESIMMSGLSLIPYTAYLGLQAHRTKFGPVWPEMLAKTGFLAPIGRVLIQILPAVFLSPLFLVPWDALHPYAQIIFSSYLPVLLFGFFLTFGPLTLWRKLGMI